MGIKNENLRMFVATAVTGIALYLMRAELPGWWIVVQGYMLWVFIFVLLSDTRPPRLFR